MAKNLLLVSSDNQFYGLMSHAATNMFSCFCDAVVGQPSPEMLKKIKQIIREKNVQAILTRGSWSIYLKQNLPLPVFPLKIDAGDIYRYLHRLSAQGYRRVGFVIYSYSPEAPKQRSGIEVYQFGDFHLFVSHVNDHKELNEVVEEIIRTYRAEYIIGDVEAMQAAVRCGIPSSVIQLENIYAEESVQQARYIVQLNEAEHSRIEYITSILNLTSEAVVTFGPEGQIIHFNTAATTMFPVDLDENAQIQKLLGMELQEIMALRVNQLIVINGNRYIANIISTKFHNRPSYALILYNTRYIQEVELSLRKQQEQGMKAKYTFADMVAVDPKTLALVDMAKRYADSQGTILICGETGTGKEVLASAIHNASPRKNGPFVALNCATLSEGLIESELFGYEKGAFTGARSNGKRGLFELAHHGTIFLDEIGDLPLNLQVKLLRVLQEREIMHIGGDRIIPVDVRVIAATNRNLKEMMREGKFREDLYYRLDLLELNIPPLRERPKDIIPLFLHFLDRHMYKNDKHLSWSSADIFSPLQHQNWPGNIRELENLAERTVLLADAHKIDDALISQMQGKPERLAYEQTISVPLTCDLRQAEASYVAALLQRFGGDRTELCDYLHISRPTLWRKLNYNDAEPSSLPEI